MVATTERQLRTLSRELLQLDQQIRALLKRQTELHERKTRLEAARGCFKTKPGGDFYSTGWITTTTFDTRIARLYARAGAGLGTPA